MKREMRVKDLKNIIDKLPEELLVVIPIISEEDSNKIYGFKKVGTAGLLECDVKKEEDRGAICLNAAKPGYDIADQVYLSGKSDIVSVKKILFGDRDESYLK